MTNPWQQDRDHDGVGDLCDVPNGDTDCDFFVKPNDLRALLLDVGLVPRDTTQVCTNIEAGTRPPDDLNCDGSVTPADLLPLLRYFAGLATGDENCVAIGN